MNFETIAEQLFFTTVRIDTTTNNDWDRCGTGTGFFISHVINDVDYRFIVTNKHVVNGMTKGRLSFHRSMAGQPVLGDGFTLVVPTLNWTNLWFGHPDPSIDIAICPLVPLLQFMREQHGVEVFFRSLPTTIIPTKEQLKELDALETVTFLGYPQGVWDRKNLLPVARRGTTASPIDVDFERTPRFIIDASVFGGSSGSPVFILNQGSWATKQGGLVSGSRFFFVGVIAAVYQQTHMNEIVSVPIPTQVQPMAVQRENLNLGIVFKAHTVTDTVEAFLKTYNDDTSTSIEAN